MSSTLALLKQPIAIREEFISKAHSTLRVKKHDRSLPGADFTISTPQAEHTTSKEPETLFTVDGKTASLSQKRTFRDTSGLPLFELSRHNKVGATWFVQLPGANSEPIVTLAPRFAILKDRVDVHVVNAAENGKTVTLEVRGQDIFKHKTKVYHDDVLVMEAEVVEKSAIWIPGKGPEWHVEVAEGLDISLASVIIVMLAATMYNSSMTASIVAGASGTPAGMA